MLHTGTVKGGVPLQIGEAHHQKGLGPGNQVTVSKIKLSVKQVSVLMCLRMCELHAKTLHYCECVSMKVCVCVSLCVCVCVNVCCVCV